MRGIIERLDIASRDETQATVMLYREAAERIAELEAQLAAVTEALTPSAETKARYWGGDDLPMMNWNDIKLLMKIIRERASLSQEGEG